MGLFDFLKKKKKVEAAPQPVIEKKAEAEEPKAEESIDISDFDNVTLDGPSKRFEAPKKESDPFEALLSEIAKGENKDK